MASSRPGGTSRPRRATLAADVRRVGGHQSRGQFGGDGGQATLVTL